MPRNEDPQPPASDEQPLSINCFNPDSILQICPRRPLLSSQAMGWDGLILKDHRQPAHVTPEHQLTQHVLILSPPDRLTKVEYILGDQSFNGQYGNGNVTIVPAQVRQRCRWYQEAEFMTLSLDPKFLVNAAYEEIEVNRFELLPHLAIQDRLIYDIGMALRQELNSPERPYYLYIDSLITALTMHLMQRYATRTSQPKRSEQGLTDASLRLALDYINDNLDRNLKLNDIAEQVGMSRYYFARLFKQSMGIAPHQYAIKQRINRAKQLLRNSNLAIADIAQQCGFTNPSHLSKYFRQLTGTTPKAYRDQLR